MVHHTLIHIPPQSFGVHLITDQIVNAVELKGSGMLYLFIQHTSAALAINESVSPDVLHDVHHFFSKLVPESPDYAHHDEGPDDMPAHIKSILCSTTLTIPYVNKRLLLGTWQGIYLMEFRKKAGSRSIVASQFT